MLSLPNQNRLRRLIPLSVISLLSAGLLGGCVGGEVSGVGENSPGSGGQSLQGNAAKAKKCKNPCYNGWTCNPQTGKCEPPSGVDASGSTDAATAVDAATVQADAAAMQADAAAKTDAQRQTDASPQPHPDASVSNTGVGKNGGSVSLLNFIVFGDVRAPATNSTSHWPAQIVQSIFTQGMSHSPQFFVATGDYYFANDASDVQAQGNMLLSLEQQIAPHLTFFHVMGNHECNNATNSNCPNANETPNVQFYMQYLGNDPNNPYFSVNVATSLGLAKFVFIAANAWSSQQQSWLQQTLAQPTTYTFIVRHEAAGVGTGNSAPGTTPSEQIIAQYPYTLELLGHDHTYRHLAANRVISGNGGAPLESGGSYGFLQVQQQSNGNITATEYEESSGMPSDSWTINAQGTLQ